MKQACRRLLLLIATVVALGTALSARADAPARIGLRATADLPGATYTLADIADIDGADRALVERLSAIVIGAVPRRAYTDTVTREQIETLVRQHVRLADTEWHGASAVRIRGQGQRLAADALSDAAVRALYAALEGQFTAIELRALGKPDGINVPAGAVQLEARVPPPAALSRRMSALVDVRVDGQVYTTVPVWFAVRATRPALVAKGPLQPGVALRAEDFDVRTVDVTEVASPALPAGSAIGEMRLRRAVEPGMTLAAAHVEARPSVTKSEQVAVRVVQGAVTIETVGTALADARVGELIKVKNTNTNESYTARVVAAGAVVVSAR